MVAIWFCQLAMADFVTGQQKTLSGLDIARRQEAKSWGLRAATSLARLW
jgi:hypothetical protein